MGNRLAVTIRPYDPARDARAWRACLIEQQDFHRALEPHWPPGHAIIDDYQRHLLDLCARLDGGVLLAEHDGVVVGFACVFTNASTDSPDDPSPFAFLAEIYVKAPSRGQGVGTALMAEAEAFVRARGAKELRLAVLERNGDARAVYRARGFRDYSRTLIKPL